MTEKNKIIRGSKGGSKKPKTPTKAKDSLNSRQFFTVQDLVSEGEIEGFATASKFNLTPFTTSYNNACLKDVFLDDTPILSDDASNTNPQDKDFNFRETKFKYKLGTSNQSKMGGIAAEIRSPETVGGIPSNADNHTTWAANKKYKVNNIVRASGVVDIVFKCTSAGTSGASQPSAFQTASVNQTITDNTVTWKAQVRGSITGSVTKQLADRSPNDNPDAVIVTLTWPQIQKFESDGDIKGLTVHYRIQTKYANQSNFVTRKDTKVKGRTPDVYSKDHRISLENAAFPVDVRVLRDSNDPVPDKKFSEFRFAAIQEVFDVSNRYLNSAYFALRLDSIEFDSVPTRLYRIRGIKVKIPASNSSGTVSIDSRSGRVKYPQNYVFDGSMGAAQWTTCPSLILLDLLINKRYGLGDHIAPDQSTDATTYSNVDLYSFIAASKYSNELVDDGFNGREARFACNVNINSTKEAFAVINELAGVMRCMPIWSAGSITINQDKSVTPSYLFNLSNVGEAGFNYSGSSLKTRHSVIKVGYLNMDSKEIDFEVIEANDEIKARVGITVKNIKAFGCTSRGQAARLGRAVLFAEQFESEVVTFTTSIDAGLVVRPGSVVEVDDPVRTTTRKGGRVVSSTTTVVTIDGKIDGGTANYLPSLNSTPRISVVLPDGTVEEKLIDDYSSDGSQVTVNSAFSIAPNAGAAYILSSNDGIYKRLYRVVQVEEQDGFNYAITALAYASGKYDFIEDGTELPVRQTHDSFNTNVNAPTGLNVQELIVSINGVARSKTILSWKEPSRDITTQDGSVIQSPQGVSQYQLRYRFVTGEDDADNFITQTVYSNDFEIMDTKAGSYDIEITPFNGNLQLSSNSLEETITTRGKTGIPDDVQNLSVEPINNQFVRLQFDQTIDLDVLHGGRVYVRHTDKTGTAATFQSSQDIIEAVAGSTNSVIAPAIAGTYLVKFQDDRGNFSNQEAKAELSLVDIQDEVVVKVDREDTDTPTWNNTTSALFNRTEYSSARGGLILSDPTTEISGTYSQADSKTLTCNITSHGLAVGETFDFSFSTGKAKDKRYSVASVTNANVFTILSSEKITTSGDVSVRKGMNGTYSFNDILDLGGVFTLNLKRHFSGVGFYPSALFDDRQDLIDTWDDFDGATANNANAKIAVRTTSAAPSSSSYADSDFTNKVFNDFSNGAIKGRGFQFKISLSTTDIAQNMNLQQGGYTATMVKRDEESGLLFSDTAGDGTGTATAKTITFANSFFTQGSPHPVPLPTVTISPRNMATGDYYVLDNITATGFRVEFKNSSNATIIRSFNYIAVGFGKGG